MKAIKVICWQLVFIAICACANAKTAPQDTAQDTTQVAEATIEAVKEQRTIFYDITFEEALEKAKAENKYVLIDFYTKTCGPCKKMEKVVFSTPECGEYINERFISIKIDGEDEGIGAEIAKKYKVFIFPTYLILTPNCFKEGEISGAEYDVNKFLDMLKTILHEK